MMTAESRRRRNVAKADEVEGKESSASGVLLLAETPRFSEAPPPFTPPAEIPIPPLATHLLFRAMAMAYLHIFAVNRSSFWPMKGEGIISAGAKGHG